MPASANESAKFNSTTEQKYQRNDVKTTDDMEEWKKMENLNAFLRSENEPE